MWSRDHAGLETLTSLTTCDLNNESFYSTTKIILTIRCKDLLFWWNVKECGNRQGVSEKSKPKYFAISLAQLGEQLKRASYLPQILRKVTSC